MGGLWNASIYVGAIFLVLAVIDFLYKRWFLSRYGKNVKTMPYLPIVGSVYLVRYKNIIELVQEWSVKIKTSCYFWIFHTPYFFTMDPKVIKVILTHPKTVNKSFVYTLLKPVVKDAIAVAEAKIWRKNRKVLVRAVAQKQLDEYQTLFNQLPDSFLETLGEKDVKHSKEINEFSEKILLDVFLTGLCKFDHQYSTADMSNMEDLDLYKTVKFVYQETIDRFLKPWFYSDFVYFSTARGRNYNRMHKILDKAFMQIFAERQAILDESRKGFLDKNEVNNIIDVMLVNDMDPDLMIGELKFQAVAASDTSAFTLSLLLSILGCHPDIQEKIYKEVTEVLGNQEVVLPSHLVELKYTEMAIMETLRIFPPIPIIGRSTAEDIDIDGTIIPKNTDILIGIMQLHRNEAYWPEPMKFMPERFASEEVKDRDPYLYIPFSAGQRNCLGGRYAICLLKTAVAKIIRKYRITSPLKCIEDIKVKSNVSLFFAEDIECTFTKRENL